jgi:hypothetical protein
MALSIKIDLSGAYAKLDRLQQRQIPFATAGTLTDVARAIAKAESAETRRDFDRPTPFTQNAFGAIPARKASPIAVVFAKDIQSSYLLPYVQGGTQVLGSKEAILTPRKIDLNAYGNLPRSKLASLKGRPDIYVGSVTTKNGGTVGGVWQRVSVTRKGIVRRGKRANRGAYFSPAEGRLKLLIQFTRPAEVTHRFPFRDVAVRTFRREIDGAWARNLSHALATAR